MTAPDPAKESELLMLIRLSLHFLAGRVALSLKPVPSMQGMGKEGDSVRW